MPKRNAQSSDDDPLRVWANIPAHESPEEKAARLADEAEARKRSAAIDEELKRGVEKKSGKPVKVLLLGQSESGKSTTLKNFQLINSSKAFGAERAIWRAVVHLNVVRSVRLILDVLTEAQALGASDSDSELPTLSPELLKLKMRLSPLLSVEELLWRKLNPGGVIPFDHASTSLGTIYQALEPSVNSTASWKDAFGILRSHSRAGDNRDSLDSHYDIDFANPGDPAVILNNCAEDIVRVWNDRTVRTILHMQKVRLEDTPGFFLDSVERVTSHQYVPSDDDILRARLKTLGVSEHRFTLKAGNMVGRDWRIFDVGGARTLRAAWAPFFTDMHAIIFLAPLSCFDQVLAEDMSVNRLEDSILLWKSIVSNPLLKETDLILFLNKCDILQAKLEAGIPFNKWVLSYGDRPNTFESASQYMKKKFAAILKQQSPQPRAFYSHFTSVTDKNSTALILGNIKDMLVRQHLLSSNMVVS